MTKILQGLKNFFAPSWPKVILAVLLILLDIWLLSYGIDAAWSCFGGQCPNGILDWILKIPALIVLFPTIAVLNLISGILGQETTNTYLFYVSAAAYSYFFSCLLITLWRKIFSRR